MRCVKYSLNIDDIRRVLIRLEETIIFSLIERVQFAFNAEIYRPGRFGDTIGENESLVGYVLHETEKVHATMRRYTAPEEEPFTGGLPAPILPPRGAMEQAPLQPNAINVTGRIRHTYEHDIVPALCSDGDDGHYGSSSVADVACLQAIAQRVHYAKFVAESKYGRDPAPFNAAIRDGDRGALLRLITVPEVETAVLERVRLKAATYSRDPGRQAPSSAIDAQLVANIYGDFIIPLSKKSNCCICWSGRPDALPYPT